jgi:ParB family chromosome partitioning protein
MNIVNINVDKLIISDINVRKTQINEIEELASSIDDIGLINPISVRKIESNDKYEIIAGQRRYLAMKSLNKHSSHKKLNTEESKQDLKSSMIKSPSNQTLETVILPG